MQLEELVSQVEEFEKLPPRDTIRLFGWYLHTHGGKEHFGSDQIRALYKQLHLVPPDVGKYVMRMVSMGTPDLARERNGL